MIRPSDQRPGGGGRGGGGRPPRTKQAGGTTGGGDGGGGESTGFRLPCFAVIAVPALTVLAACSLLAAGVAR